MAGVPAYFVVQPVAPLVLTVPAFCFSLYALFRGSNLWPLTLIFAAALGMLYLGALFLVRWWLYD
jgi:hypothetical protein